MQLKALASKRAAAAPAVRPPAPHAAAPRTPAAPTTRRPRIAAAATGGGKDSDDTVLYKFDDKTGSSSVVDSGPAPTAADSAAAAADSVRAAAAAVNGAVTSVNAAAADALAAAVDAAATAVAENDFSANGFGDATSGAKVEGSAAAAVESVRDAAVAVNVAADSVNAAVDAAVNSAADSVTSAAAEMAEALSANIKVPAFSSPLPPPPARPATAAPARPADPVPSTPSEVAAVKLELLQRVAGLNRGALASAFDRNRIDAIARSLEASPWRAANAAAANATTNALLTGRWELLYANTEAFRNSPFFGAFSNVVSGITNDDGQIADMIFAFTDAIPNATVGAAYQTISLGAGSSGGSSSGNGSGAAGAGAAGAGASGTTADVVGYQGSLVSEVDLAVFPGLKGTVVTASRISKRWEGSSVSGSSGGGSSGSGGGGSSGGGSASSPIFLDLTVESTRVEKSNFSPLLDSITVPVEQLIERITGMGATRVVYEVTYLDAALRITRCGRQLMVHRRV